MRPALTSAPKGVACAAVSPADGTDSAEEEPRDAKAPRGTENNEQGWKNDERMFKDPRHKAQGTSYKVQGRNKHNRKPLF